LLEALERRFLETSQPAGLTVFEPCNAALGERGGVLRFSHPGFLKRIVASAFPARAVELARMIADNEVEAYCYPMGVLYSLARESGAGRPGLLSEVGLGTFVDPRNGGGSLNASSTNGLASLMRNLSMEREPLTLGVMTLATATKASGGKVFVQVERIVPNGTLHPKDILVPGALVDGIVLSPDAPQSGASRFDPTITGEERGAIPQFAIQGAADRVILARAAGFVRRGWLINLGVGISNRLPRILHEAGLLEAVTFSTEHGAFGGLPSEPPVFGAHVNPTALVDPTDTFNIYTGGILDAAYLGMAEADQDGNINVSRFGSRIMGPGGFMDITARTRNIFICGSFTAGGLAVENRSGRLEIVTEGRNRKLVGAVKQVTLNGRQALSRGQTLTLITERALFMLDEQGWELREIAPGIDPARDIAPAMEFPLRVSQKLREYSGPVMGAAGAAFDRWLASSLDAETQPGEHVEAAQ
jgi:propionate CoA-transferase